MLFSPRQIEASPVFVPERSAPDEPLFSYRIETRLLNVDGDEAVTECQLSHRYWRIEDEYAGFVAQRP
jgi:uncharacterized protein affecting Mg2+/Co2+ transport